MKRTQQEHVARARWAAVGAAVAVTLGVGGLAVTNAVVNSGEKAVFVPISPCRLFDLRPAPDQVGPRSAPLVAGETYTQTVRGVNGNCNIPADASAVAMNVTATGGTAGSFLTLWPSDVTPKPLASNLNWVPGSPPTPNKVDVKLSADGKINLFNLAGSVSVLADVVGYYADHNHDDRYYTEAESDDRYYSKAEIDAKLSSEIVISHGLMFFPNGSIPTTIGNFQDVSLIGPGVARLQIVGPKSQTGVAYGLQSVTYCMNGATAPAFVNIAEVAATAPAFVIKSDTTNRTAAGCYVVTVNDPVSTSFTFAFWVGGAGGFIEIIGVTSTWAPVSLIPTSVSAADASSGEGLAP